LFRQWLHGTNTQVCQSIDRSFGLNPNERSWQSGQGNVH
jgi:hypothetical protein